MKTLILDTEGNGSKPEQMCQLAYVAVDDGVAVGKNFFFSVDSMSDHAHAVHGLSKYRLYELSGGKSFKQRFSEFSDELLSTDMYAGHNVAADVRCLRIEFSRCEMALPQVPTFCTMKHFNNALHLRGRTGQRKPPNLGELTKYFGIRYDVICEECARIFGLDDYHAHDARFDATATYLCIQEAQRRGDVKGVF